MRYETIDNKLFIQNRERLVKEMKPGSVAILFSNDMMPRSADSFHAFRQNPDIFHLTGVDQEDSILVLFPDSPNPDWKEVLFVKETSELIAIWVGDKLSKEQATAVSGIQNIVWTRNFDVMFPTIMYQAQNCYLNLTEHDRFSSPAEYGDLRQVRNIMHQFPLHHYERLAPIMHRIRSVKSPIEVAIILHACDITHKGVERVLRFVKPGVMEYEIEAEFTHEFLRNRSRGHAYGPIIASGKNACTLHYDVNDQQCKDGDLILIDVGAEYANYASDLTRTIPVNGRYTQRQKDVYNAVLRVFKGAKKLLLPGNTLKEHLEATAGLIEKELVDLKLITTDDIRNQDPANPVYRKYFMHGVSHYLGIDVHDVGSRYQKMTAGNIFTCEPGIYIREEGIGVRIENDILITEIGQVDLMEKIPIEVEQIEDIMNSGK